LLTHTKYLWLKVHVKVYAYQLHFDQGLNILHIKNSGKYEELTFFMSALGYGTIIQPVNEGWGRLSIRESMPS